METTIEDAVQALLEERNEIQVEDAYRIISNLCSNKDTYGNSPNIDYVCDNGYLQILADEIMRDPIREDVVQRGVSSLTHVALSQRNALAVANSGIIRPLYILSKELPDEEIGDIAFTCLSSMALHSPARGPLMEAGVLRLALKHLSYLNATDDRGLDFGLTAASLICRLVGREESGLGPDAIRDNHKLLEKTWGLLSQVVEKGESEVIYGYTRNPANIMLDISILAIADRNKPLLVKFIALVIKGIQKFKHNQRFLVYAIHMLSQLWFEKTCTPKFDEYSEQLLRILVDVMPNFVNDTNTFQLANGLLSSIQTRARTLMKTADVVTSSSSLPETVQPVPPLNETMVMISYHFESQALAKEIQNAFRLKGIKTLLHNLTPGIADNTLESVGSSTHMVVVFARKYKESGNCRKECEIACQLKKTFFFVKTDPFYKEEGWLKQIIAKNEPIPCYNVGMITKTCEELIKMTLSKN